MEKKREKGSDELRGALPLPGWVWSGYYGVSSGAYAYNLPTCRYNERLNTQTQVRWDWGGWRGGRESEWSGRLFSLNRERETETERVGVWQSGSPAWAWANYLLCYYCVELEPPSEIWPMVAVQESARSAQGLLH
jgi:hypothetical protein